MSTPLAEAFVRISLDMKYLRAQQQQAQKMLSDFANQKISRSMTPTDVYNGAFSKAFKDAASGAVALADSMGLVHQMEATAVAQAQAMAEQIREANAAADPLVTKMRNLQQLQTLMRGGYLSGEDAAIAARRLNGPTAGEADEKRLANIAKQAYDSTRTAAEQYRQTVEKLNAARSQMGEDTYHRAIAAAGAEYQRAARAADPFIKAQERINALILQGVPAANKLATAEKQLAAEMQKLGYSQAQQDTALKGLKQTFGMSADSGRRFNAMMQQASFGAQDFITVMAGGGGLQMAMMSAANNAAQVAAISGGMGGAFAGVAVTIAAVLIPAMLKLVDVYIHLGEATEEMKKKQEQTAQFLEQRAPTAREVAERGGEPARRKQKIEDIDTAKQAEAELDRQRQAAEDRKGAEAATLKDLEDQRAKLLAMEKERKAMGRKSTVASEAHQFIRENDAMNATGLGPLAEKAMNYFGVSEEERSASRSNTDLEISDVQNKAREKLDKEILDQRKRVEEGSRELDRIHREEAADKALAGPARNKAIDLQEKEMDAANKKFRQKKEKEEKTARDAYKRENLAISGDMNEYESRRIAVQEKYDARRERLEGNKFITEQERNRSLKLAEEARDSDLKKLEKTETHRKNHALRDAKAMEKAAENIANPHLAAQAQIAAKYRAERDKINENEFLSKEEKERIKGKLNTAEKYEKERAGFSPQMMGLQQLHAEIQKSLYRSPEQQSAHQTANNTQQIVKSSERTAIAVEKIAGTQEKQTSTYA